MNKLLPHLHHWTTIVDLEWDQPVLRKCRCLRTEVFVDGKWKHATLSDQYGPKVWLVTAWKDRFNICLAYIQHRHNVEHLEILPLFTPEDWQGLLDYSAAGKRPSFIFDPVHWYENEYIKNPEFPKFFSRSLDLL